MACGHRFGSQVQLGGAVSWARHVTSESQFLKQNGNVPAELDVLSNKQMKSWPWDNQVKPRGIATMFILN